MKSLIFYIVSPFIIYFIFILIDYFIQKVVYFKTDLQLCEILKDLDKDFYIDINFKGCDFENER